MKSTCLFTVAEIISYFSPSECINYKTITKYGFELKKHSRIRNADYSPNNFIYIDIYCVTHACC